MYNTTNQEKASMATAIDNANMSTNGAAIGSNAGPAAEDTNRIADIGGIRETSIFAGDRANSIGGTPAANIAEDISPDKQANGD